MQTRQNALQEWLITVLKDSSFTISPVAGDASFRRYFRVQFASLSYIVMDAPPEKEAIIPFIQVANTLVQQGVHAPRIHAVDERQGFILLEDLGDHLLLNRLKTQPDQADFIYKAAIDTLLILQQCSTTTPSLPHFDKSFINGELLLFRNWFLDKHLNLNLSSSENKLLDETFGALTSEILNQPQVFIHRDYHSRNLLLVNDQTPFDIGVIDFQDAMQGPITYDLVSLLKDCYIQWPRKQILQWVNYFYQRLPLEHQSNVSDFQRAFDLAGLQRHLKVLGIFCRLNYRDGKSSYLGDLPLTFQYVMACLENYPEWQPFYRFMQQRCSSFFECVS